MPVPQPLVGWQRPTAAEVKVAPNDGFRWALSWCHSSQGSDPGLEVWKARWIYVWLLATSLFLIHVNHDNPTTGNDAEP